MDTLYCGDVDSVGPYFKYSAATKTLELSAPALFLEDKGDDYRGEELIRNDSVEGLTITLKQPLTVYVVASKSSHARQDVIEINSKTIIDTQGNKLTIVGQDWISEFNAAKDTGIRPEYNMDVGADYTNRVLGFAMADPSDLTIQNSDIEIIGTTGIYCKAAEVDYQVYEYDVVPDPEFEYGVRDKYRKSQLNIVNSNITIDATEEAIFGITRGISLENCYIAAPDTAAVVQREHDPDTFHVPHTRLGIYEWHFTSKTTSYYNICSQHLEIRAGNPTTTVTASGDCGTDAHWALDSAGTLTVSAVGILGDINPVGAEMSDFEQPWDNWRGSIQKVVVQDGVTRIGFNAFASLPNLKTVSLGEHVRWITTSAFDDSPVEAYTVERRNSGRRYQKEATRTNR